MSILKNFEIITSSPQKTITLGERLGQFLKCGDIVSLTGELGSGKTTFIQGIAKGLAIKGPVNSPTFSLLNIYKGKNPFCHFDLYRIDEKEDIGYDEFFHPPYICVIEWGEKAAKFLPPEYLKINLNHIDRHTRRFLFLPKGKHFIELVKNVLLI